MNFQEQGTQNINQQNSNRQNTNTEDVWVSQFGGKAEFNRLQPVIQSENRETLIEFQMEEQITKNKNNKKMETQLGDYKLIDKQTLNLESQYNDLAQGDENKNRNRVSTILRSKITNFFQTKQKNIIEWITTRYSKIQTIQPTSTLKIIWDCLHIFGILFVCFYTPLESLNGIFFDTRTELYNDYWIAFKAITLFFFIIDIFLKFNTEIYQKGQLIKSKIEIAKNYLQGTFTIDILSFIPIIMSVAHIKGFYQFFNLLILLKIYTARRLLTHFQDMFNHQQKFKSFLSIVKLWLIIIMIGHTFACLFQLLAVREEMAGIQSWMSVKNLLNSHFLVKYIYSLHFSATTMLTVGYGDIVPVNSYEALFVIFQMLISCGVFAYSFNQIGEIIKDYNKVNDEFKSQMIVVNKLLEKKQLSTDLQLKVRKYLEYKFFNEPQITMEQEAQVMVKLTDKLQQDIMNEYYTNILKKFHFFSNLSNESLAKICLSVKEVKVQLNDYVFEENDQSDPFLCFIENGSVDICYESTKSSEVIILQTLQRGQQFGEFSFFTGQPRTASAKTSEGAVIYCLQRQNFIDIVKQFPQDYEKFCRVKDQFLQETMKVYMQCYSCHNFGHYAKDCPKLHYKPNKEILILKNQFSRQQHRIKFKRKNDYKQEQFIQNALKSNSSITKQINEFLKKFKQKELQLNSLQQAQQLEQIKSSSEDSSSDLDSPDNIIQNNNNIVQSQFKKSSKVQKQTAKENENKNLIIQINANQESERQQAKNSFQKQKSAKTKLIQSDLPDNPGNRLKKQSTLYIDQNNDNTNQLQLPNQNNDQLQHQNSIYVVGQRRSSIMQILHRDTLQVNQVQVNSKKLEIDQLLKDLELDRNDNYYEIYKEFKHYFPQGNIQNVIRSMNNKNSDYIYYTLNQFYLSNIKVKKKKKN